MRDLGERVKGRRNGIDEGEGTEEKHRGPSKLMRFGRGWDPLESTRDQGGERLSGLSGIDLR